MFQRRPKRFRRRSNVRNNHHGRPGNGDAQLRHRPGSFSNDRPRTNFKSQQSAERLVEKYNSLAKEALSAGDKILSENYFQHADHFIRIVDEKTLNQNQNKNNEIAKVEMSQDQSHINKENAQEETPKDKK